MLPAHKVHHRKCHKEIAVKGNYKSSKGLEDQENSQIEVLVCWAERQNKSPSDTKDLQEGFSDAGSVVYCSTLQYYLHKHDLHGQVFFHKKSLTVTSLQN